ncbi:FAD-dependent oxidoreductase [Pseudomonas stutzeri]|uniref:NAD(P)/FAD-dependent oxidoreductase n=1 Tax=Stutzerimonas stutzeri TaxID=316 RepID=UPI00210AD9E9|nr:FAD-dependent oxidoreductase [Stutzerimonas stutzeri]MCQ4314306.1 FAD-dependent oxidoreductase [Stutzerimonas stutzeri]
MTKRIIIVGTGQSGVSLAFKLRMLGCQEEITLIGEEPDLPYHRPPLSKKYVTNLAEADGLYLKPKQLYESERIELRLGCRITTLDRTAKSVTLDDGTTLRYDWLALATGANARRLPASIGGDARNVYTLRTLADARALRDEFGKGRQLLVVGGGYIGLETAAVARSLGMHVTLIEQADRILNRVASVETASYFNALHLQNGVVIREGVGLDGLEQHEGRAVRARLSDGSEMDVDVVVAGIGVNPATELAERAGLVVVNGIVVDSCGRTSDPSIYASGDCAFFPYRGVHMRLESIQNAVDMADVVARSMLGEEPHYLPIPWFWSDQYATKLQIAGLHLGYNRVAVREAPRSGLSVWYFDDDRFLAVDAINDPKAFMTAKRWLTAGFNPSFDALADPSVELSAIPEFVPTRTNTTQEI